MVKQFTEKLLGFNMTRGLSRFGEELLLLLGLAILRTPTPYHSLTTPIGYPCRSAIEGDINALSQN